jgi:hypothetical protein
LTRGGSSGVRGGSNAPRAINPGGAPIVALIPPEAVSPPSILTGVDEGSTAARKEYNKRRANRLRRATRKQ